MYFWTEGNANALLWVSKNSPVSATRASDFAEKALASAYLA